MGTRLGVSVTILDRINKEKHDSSRKLQAMIQSWYNSSPKRCWEHVIQALVDIHRVKLASQIADERKLIGSSFLLLSYKDTQHRN